MCGGASVILHAAQLERRFFPCPRARYKLRARIATSLHSVCPKKKKKTRRKRNEKVPLFLHVSLLDVRVESPLRNS